MKALKSRILTAAVLSLVLPAAAGLAGVPSVAEASALQSARVLPSAETDAVASGSDAADDPSIWVHPSDPAKSMIIATNKDGGILVYDLNGRQKYSYETGRMNNIDVRYGFKLAGQTVDIAAATNRTTNSIDIFAIDKSTGALRAVSGTPIVSSMSEVYGFSLYHSLKTGKYYALVLGKEGEFEQYELFDNGKGAIDGKKVREFKLATQSEGIVADDEYGRLYIAEEDAGVWLYGAEPGDGDVRETVAAVDGVKLTADVEGLTLYYAEDGDGYLIASSQGSSSYAVFDREDGEYEGSFVIADAPGIDGTSETDGIDVLGFGLGSQYPKGLFIAQDDENLQDGAVINQNFKIVKWDAISDAFEDVFGDDLDVDNDIDPRKLEYREED
ncbi:phytase [Paenibacillus mucilaginosus]|uniref:phytase n=1 Tax=Paenibacillus mucilaginosus TaxID=61624 RepID=UPI0002E14DA7|nr:phytase [Paenibacillus mucilaginosus]MCG7212485.1 phytase [Paenibacillus mucilaginosus]WDM25479.1 phytase [Paenibacillus mucilaginosus]